MIIDHKQADCPSPKSSKARRSNRNSRNKNETTETTQQEHNGYHPSKELMKSQYAPGNSKNKIRANKGKPNDGDIMQEDDKEESSVGGDYVPSSGEDSSSEDDNMSFDSEDEEAIRNMNGINAEDISISDARDQQELVLRETQNYISQDNNNSAILQQRYQGNVPRLVIYVNDPNSIQHSGSSYSNNSQQTQPQQ